MPAARVPEGQGVARPQDAPTAQREPQHQAEVIEHAERAQLAVGGEHPFPQHDHRAHARGFDERYFAGEDVAFSRAIARVQ